MRRSEDYYSEIAAGYDELHGAEQDAKLAKFLKRAEVSRVLTSPKTRLLDVGCGTGRTFKLLPHVDWYGIEPSKGLVFQAPKDAQERIALGRGEELPWREGTFDAVLSLTALQNYNDPEAGVREMARVAKQDGLILISFLRKSPKRDELERIIRTSLHGVESWEFQQDVMFVCRKSG